MTRDTIKASVERFTEREIIVTVALGAHTKALHLSAWEPVWHTRPSTLDFVAVALSQFASALGCDVYVDGPVSGAQLQNIDEFLQIWSIWRPDCFQRVDFACASEVDCPPPASPKSLMAFSGGVDASFALLAHHERRLGRLSREIDLAVLVIGWDLKHGDDAARALAVDAAQDTLGEFGVRCVPVATNWQQEFCPHWFLGFNIGLSSLLQTFAGRFGSAVMASDHNYAEELRIGAYGSHMVVNHLLGTPGFQIITTGGTHTRLERVREIARHPTLLRKLRVCYQQDAGGRNCGHCEKCVRTQLELLAAGADPSGAFPTPFTAQDIDDLSVLSISGVMFLEEILAHLDPAGPHHGRLAAVAAREARKFRDQAHTRAESDLADARARLDLAHERIAALESSTSWRMTAPLRRLRAALRR